MKNENPMQDTIKKSDLLNRLGNFIECRPIYSERSGEAVRNQYEVVFERGRIFQSYQTLIAVRHDGELFLSDSHDYSVTTSKYCGQWTGYNTAERREGLKSGKFIRIVND